MTPRLLLLAVLFAAPCLAAPAPFRKPNGSPVPVEITGHCRRAPAAGDPVVIGRRADWLAVAEAWGITDPPRLDFRTHVLAVHLGWSHETPVRFVVSSGGDVRVLTRNRGGLEELSGLVVPTYTVRSFRRSEIRTVGGLPLPKE